MDKNDEEVGNEFERLINEMEKYSVKDGRKLNDEYRKVRDERPVEDDGSMPEHERAAMGDDGRLTAEDDGSLPEHERAAMGDDLRRAVDADLYDMGYEDGYHDGKADMMNELEDKLAEGRDGAVDDGEVSEEDYKAYMAERARILGEAGRDDGAGSTGECGGHGGAYGGGGGAYGGGGTGEGGGRGGAYGGGGTDEGGGRGGECGGGLGGRWKSFAGNNPNSSQWLRTVAASLVATTLGILITFGTKSCETDVEERRADRQATIDVLYNLDTNIKQFEKDYGKIREKDSIMQKMLNAYMSAEQIRMTGKGMEDIEKYDSIMSEYSQPFINCLLNYNIIIFDTSMEQAFMNSGTASKVFGDRTLRSLLSGFYTLELSTINKMKAVNDDGAAIMTRMFVDKRRLSAVSAKEYAMTLLNDESVREYIVNTGFVRMQVEMCISSLHKFYDEILANTDITDEEINQASKYDNFEFNENSKDSIDA